MSFTMISATSKKDIAAKIAWRRKQEQNSTIEKTLKCDDEIEKVMQQSKRHFDEIISKEHFEDEGK